MSSRRSLLLIAAVPTALIGLLFVLLAGHLRDPWLAFNLMRGYALGITNQLTSEEWSYLTAARKLALRRPATEAKRALAEGNDRLVGVLGYGLFFPGVPDAFRNVVTDEKDLAFSFLGAGDSSVNRTDLIYQAASYRFALRYNEIVWPQLQRTMPGPALGITQDRADGEAYFWHGGAGTMVLPPPGTSVVLLRLSVNRRFDLLEGVTRDVGDTQSFVVLQRPYTRLVGRAFLDGALIRVRYTKESRDQVGAVVTQTGDAALQKQGASLIFEGRVLEPCPWIDNAHFYVTFAQF